MHKIVDQYPAVKLYEGQPMLSFWLSDAGPLPQEFYSFVDEMCDPNNNKECVLELAIPLSGVVDGMIDSLRQQSHIGRIVFHEEDRGSVAAARAALQSAIEKLDAIEYTDEHQPF